MTEPKFRIFHKVTGKLYLPGEFRVKSNWGKGSMGWAVIIPDRGHPGGVATSEFEFEYFTGLYDKKGQEIYVGDIVELRIMYRPHPGCPDDEMLPASFILTANFSSGAFWLRSRSYATCLHFHYHNKDRELLGNIHANPELLLTQEAADGL